MKYSIFKMKEILVLIPLLFLMISCSEDRTAEPEKEDNVEIPFRPQNVLFIGNSHTRFNQGVDFYLKGFLDNLNLPYEPFIERSAFDGYTLDEHLENNSTTSILESKNWDIVVLQENTFKAANDKLGAKVAMESFKFAITNNDTQLYLFLTWAYEDEPEMLSKIIETYEETGVLLKAKVVPVGVAFRDFKNANGETINLYNPDGVHPSIAGSFLAASMFYYAIYNEDPTKNDYTASLEEATADLLKQMAKEAIDAY